MTAPEPPLVELESVRVRANGAAVLNGVGFEVSCRTIHILAGPNGSGKTTLLRAILGQIPFQGRIRCHWRAEGRIGYVPQALDFDREMPLTVADFMSLMRQKRPIFLGSSPDARRNTAEALDLVGMQDRADRRLGVLSGGELQRVLLARALLPPPELLLLDEPTSGVDEVGTRKLRDALLELKTRGVTTLMASHDEGFFGPIADRVTRIRLGALV